MQWVTTNRGTQSDCFGKSKHSAIHQTSSHNWSRCSVTLIRRKKISATFRTFYNCWTRSSVSKNLPVRSISRIKKPWMRSCNVIGLKSTTNSSMMLSFTTGSIRSCLCWHWSVIRSCLLWPGCMQLHNYPRSASISKVLSQVRGISCITCKSIMCNPFSHLLCSSRTI